MQSKADLGRLLAGWLAGGWLSPVLANIKIVNEVHQKYDSEQRRLSRTCPARPMLVWLAGSLAEWLAH